MTTSLLARQTLLARVLDDPALERAVREAPDRAAVEHGVPEAFARWIASLDPLRLAAFRTSRAHKDELRRGG